VPAALKAAGGRPVGRRGPFSLFFLPALGFKGRIFSLAAQASADFLVRICYKYFYTGHFLLFVFSLKLPNRNWNVKI
jgi:hypothetical protein